MPVSREEFLKLKPDPEEYVRKALEKELKTPLRKVRLPPSDPSEEEPRSHEFDLVSTDMDVIVQVKSGKQYDKVRFDELMSDCYLLEKRKAKKKILVLTDQTVYDKFKKDSRGWVSRDVEIRLIGID